MWLCSHFAKLRVCFQDKFGLERFSDFGSKTIIVHVENCHAKSMVKSIRRQTDMQVCS